MPRRSKASPDLLMGDTAKAWRRTLRELDRGTAAVMPDLNIGDLHPIAEDWWDGLKDAAISKLWSPEDWIVAKGAAVLLHMFHTNPWEPRYHEAFVQACNSLVVTELSRRRAMVKLRMPGDESEDQDDSDAAEPEIDETRRSYGPAA